MDNNVDDVNRDALDNLLTAADDNDDNGDDDVSVDALSRQLLLTTASLKASVDIIDVKMNEMKSDQNDMKSNVDQLEKAVFKADIHVTQSNKQRRGRALEVLNEEGALNGGSDDDDGSDANSSTRDDGNV